MGFELLINYTLPPLRARSSTATVSSPGGSRSSGTCRVLRLGRAELGAMAAEAPAALNALQVGSAGAWSPLGYPCAQPLLR